MGQLFCNRSGSSPCQRHDRKIGSSHVSKGDRRCGGSLPGGHFNMPIDDELSDQPLSELPGPLIHFALGLLLGVAI
jgi:hypothetical protein